MAVTEVSICSNALLMLGANTINSFSEKTDRAKLAANLWEPVRDFVIRSHPWNCCIKRAALAPDASAPEFDWDYQFTLPPDYMRVISVGEFGSEELYEIENGKLLCNANPALLRYIYKNENPAKWDAMLQWAMTMAMKAVFANPTTASTNYEQIIELALQSTLKRARAADGQEGTPATLGDTPLISSRFGGGW